MVPTGGNARTRAAIFALLAAGSILGIAGTDLVLPAIPTLPAALGGDAIQAQLVLAAYVGGSALGLLGFAAAGDHLDVRHLLPASMAVFAMLSLACMAVDGPQGLIVLRFFQGAASSAPAVFAPGIIRRMYDETGAIAAIGRLGSIEALTPALAPLAGAWLLAVFGWRGSFAASAILALLAAGALLACRGLLPSPSARGRGSYLRLLRSPAFLRHALGQACVLGGLIVFVFGAPTVFVQTMGGSLADFIRMQIMGVTAFIVAANLTVRLVRRLGAERVILLGTALSIAASAAILAYGLFGRDPLVVSLLFVPMTVGLGLRGPPSFVAALVASGDDDARGAALVVLAFLATAALGTAAAAPFILGGIVPLALITLLIQAGGLAVLFGLRAAGGAAP